MDKFRRTTDVCSSRKVTFVIIDVFLCSKLNSPSSHICIYIQLYPLYYLFVFVLYFVKFTIYLIFWSQEVASHQSFIDFYEILSLITHAVSTPFVTYILALLHPVGYHLLYSTHMLQSSI
jgi:hypothetical protein